MRILHARPDLLVRGAHLRAPGRVAELCDRRCRNRAGADQCGNRRTDERQHLPLLRLSQHRRGDPRGGRGGPSMKPFSYQRASDIASACASAALPAAKFVAGGTNLVDLMKLQIEAPAQLVDITRLPLARIEETATPDGSTRAIPIDELYRPPGDTPHIETALAPGELITSVLLPPPPPGRQVYRKVRDRASFAFALVSVAAVLEMDGNRVRSSRVAFGGISYKPWRSPDAEAALEGAPATRASFDAAGTAALQSARGFGHNDFKIPLARRTLRATLTQAASLA